MDNISTPSLRLPAEWEPQSGIQLTWPHADTDWKPYLDDITETYLQLVHEIAKRETLLVVTPTVQATRRQLEERLGDELMGNVIVLECDTNDTWARDHAPITLENTRSTQQDDQRFTLLNFKFNGWGEKFDWQKDNAINRKLHETGVFRGEIEDHLDFVLEGGAIESDGRGTVMTTSMCLMAPHRNQPLTQEEIEARLKESLRADRIVWIDHGNLIGDDTDGHIDTIVRMAPEDTLLYVGCDDESDEQYADFAALEQQLKALTTADGRPYSLIRLPMPRAMMDDDYRLPATYANFVVINGAVIVPTYGQPELDREAMALIGQAFPDREIVGIDASTVVRQHGSLHCITMQYPEDVLAEYMADF